MGGYAGRWPLIKRGEIYWVNLDPTVGSEIKKTRPALIVSNDQNNQFADTVTVLPITSQTAKLYPFEVLLKREISGLQEDGKAKANQIRTVDKRRLSGKPAGLPLSDRVMLEVDKAIKIHLAID